MMSMPTIGLLAAVAMAAQDPGKMPEAWEQKYEAASKEAMSGAYAKAEVLMLEVVAEAEKLGAQDPRLATPLANLGSFYAGRKRYAEAEPLLRRALAIREKALGPDHPDVARTLVSLVMCRLSNEPKEAEAVAPMLRRAVAIIEKSRGKDSPDLANALQCMFMLHLFHRDFDGAEANLRRLLAIREKASGPASIEVATVLDDLGDLYTAMSDSSSSRDFEAKVAGRPKEEWPSEQAGKKAEGFYMRSLTIREKALKPDHPDIVDSLYNLGQLASIRQQPADGEKYLGRWLKLQEAANAPASERQAKVLFMLAGASMERKDWAEAERRLAMSQKTVEELKGAESDEVSGMLASRADVALLAARFDDAEKFIRRNLAVQAAILGPDHRDIVEARTLMAESYRDHVEDRRAPMLWHQLHVLANRTEFKGHQWNLGAILDVYAKLLRRTNRVVPQPTEEDLAYLKRAGVVLDGMDLGLFTALDGVLDFKLDDEGMKHIARLYEIERLSLRGITDAGLAHIAGLINLKDLSLSNSKITDAGLAPVAGLENLEHLNVAMTRVDDAGLTYLKGLKKLRELDIAFTSVTDAGLKHLEGLKSLRSLDIKGTRITDEAVSRLRRARPDLQIEHQPGPGFMQLMRPADRPPGAPPDAAVPMKPAALAPPPELPRKP